MTLHLYRRNHRLDDVVARTVVEPYDGEILPRNDHVDLSGYTTHEIEDLPRADLNVRW